MMDDNPSSSLSSFKVGMVYDVLHAHNVVYSSEVFALNELLQ